MGHIAISDGPSEEETINSRSIKYQKDPHLGGVDARDGDEQDQRCGSEEFHHRWCISFFLGYIRWTREFFGGKQLLSAICHLL